MKLRMTAIGLGIALLGGCAPQPEMPPPPETDPMSVALPTEPADRVRQLRTTVNQLASFADELPGETEAAYRERLSLALDDLGQSLRLAYGPGTNGAMRVRVYTIFEAARHLRTRPVDAPAETLVNGALRAAYRALQALAEDQFAASSELGEQLDELEASLPALETDRGPLHRVAAARSFRRAVKALQTVGELYAARIPDVDTEPAEAAEPTTETPQDTETTPAAPADAAPDTAAPGEAAPGDAGAAQPQTPPAAPAQPQEPEEPAPQPPAQPSQPEQPREDLNK